MDHGPKKLLRRSFLISFLLHSFFIASFWFFLRSDSVDKASGSEGGEVIYVSFTGSLNKGVSELGEKSVRTSPSFVRREKGEAETYHTLSLPLQRGGSNSGDSGESGTSDLLRQIRVKIERAKFYPLIAKRTRLEGAPEVELKIRPNGLLEYVTLKKSCGSKILDDAALSTVKLAAPFPFYPEPIALNIEYNLK